MSWTGGLKGVCRGLEDGKVCVVDWRTIIQNRRSYNFSKKIRTSYLLFEIFINSLNIIYLKYSSIVR